MRQAAVVEHLRPCGHRRPRGIEDTQPQSCLMRAEHGKPVRVRYGFGFGPGYVPVSRPREPNPLRGTGCPRSECRWRKGDRKPGRDGCSSKRLVLDNWLDIRPRAWLRKQADVWQVSL